MTEIPSSETQLIRVFRYSQKTIVRTLLIFAATLLMLACILCLPMGMFGGTIYTLVGQDAAPGLMVMGAIFGCIITAVLLVPMLMNALNIMSLFKSTLEVGPEGVTQHYWSQYKIKARWQDVDHIGPYGPFKQIVMHLRDAEIDEPVIYQWRRSFFRNPYPIHLSSFEGWPEGELAETIRQYAPHLMEEYPHGTEHTRLPG